jgi:RND superfamily putative drug exporter
MTASSSRPAAAARRRRWLLPALAIVAWVVLGAVAGPYAGKLSEVAENEAGAFLPADAESTEVSEIERGFAAQQSTPLVLVWESDRASSADAQSAARGQVEAVQRIDGVLPGSSPPVLSRDGRGLTAVLQVDQDVTDELPSLVDDVRGVVSPVGGGNVFVTGPAGFAADLSAAFEGVDGLLLLVALGVVMVILLLVYRSPVLPVLVLLCSVLALGLASFAVYWLAESDLLDLNGQSQGIMSILVVGAATDYALLLVARFREELREEESRFTAMRTALRQVLGPVTASGGTVIAGVLCLLLSDLTSNRGLGPVAALGIAAAMVAALTFLPAVLVLLGRAAYWPFRPTLGSPHPERSGVWATVAGTVERRPRHWWIGVTLGLAALAALAPRFDADGVAQSDLFLERQDSVAGQEALARHFPAGTGSPALVVAKEDDWQQALEITEQSAGVQAVSPVTAEAGRPSTQADPLVVDGQVLLQATLSDPADSLAATQAVEDLRAELDQVGVDVLVGGPTAQQLDTNQISARDRAVIIPLVLVVILLVLMLLLRSVLAPVLLILTVVLSFAATLGVAALVFEHLLGWPGADPGVPLFAFVFLVALGIDYNIFLMTRVREESLRSGTRVGVITALVVTGGVITSAGIVLAATFSALAVIPLLFLGQIAFLVAFGVLLDTFVVRSLLVPALTYDLGDRVWWPSRQLRGG